MKKYEMADQLLHEYGLAEILQKYSDVHMTGSYSMNLLVWNDLDIHLVYSPEILDKRQDYHYHSNEIYDAVLNKGVVSTEQFLKEVKIQ